MHADAPVFALREWRDPDGTRVRQLLTAKPGQKPARWFGWSELRAMFLKWPGYKIIVLRRHGDVRAGAPEAAAKE